MTSCGLGSQHAGQLGGLRCEETEEASSKSVSHKKEEKKDAFVMTRNLFTCGLLLYDSYVTMRVVVGWSVVLTTVYHNEYMIYYPQQMWKTIVHF